MKASGVIGEGSDSFPIVEEIEAKKRGIRCVVCIKLLKLTNSVRLVKSELINHTTKKFADISKEAQKMSDDLGLEYINFPRKRNAPRRYQGSELVDQSYGNAEDYYRVQFYLAIDVAFAFLNDHFDSSDLKEYNKLSKMLISGILNRDAIKDYSELCDSALDIELQMYVRHYKRPCLVEHLKVFREMEPNVRCMFLQLNNC